MESEGGREGGRKEGAGRERGKAYLHEFLSDTGGVGAGLVDLVHGHQDGDVCLLGTTDGVDGLFLHSFVGCDDEDDEVSDVGTTGAHFGEGGVAGRVDEGDHAVVAALHLREIHREENGGGK